ncbi:MAG: SprB repeat-containing protein, partial [Bacteroidales bacterium]|nr:SprB repeat-containing protein [Bacteroidales bacterium]
MIFKNTLRFTNKWLHIFLFSALISQTISSQVVDWSIDITSCSGSNRGEITVTISGGTPNYNYFLYSGGIGGPLINSKTNTADTFAIFQNLNEGTYGVVVRDNDSSPLTGPPNDGILVLAFEPTIQYLGFDPITVEKGLTCYDGNDAEFMAHPKGGEPPYSYSWSNGDNTQLGTGFGVGIHQVTITDQTPCNVVSSIIFIPINYPGDIPAELTISASSSGTCQGESTGTITVNGGGGTGDLDYAIVRIATLDSTFQETNVFNNLAAGDYRVYVIDDNGCIKRLMPDLNVPEYSNPTAGITPDPAEVCAGSNLQLNGNPSGGTAPYDSHAWTGAGAGSLNNTTIQNPIFNNSSDGSYALTYTVTDDNGCTGSDNITVTVHPLPVPSASNNGPICEGQQLEIYSLPNGMNSYSWSGPNGFSSGQQDTIVSPNATLAMAGIYTVTVTDGNSCSNTANTTAVIIAAPTADADTDASICSDGTHQLAATATNYSSLQWTTSGDGSFNNDAIEDPIYTPGATDISTGSVTLTLTAFGNAPCGNDADDMDLTIVTAPSADAGLDATICSDDSHTLNATATNYSSLQWSTSGDGSFNNDAIEDPVYTPGLNDISSGSVTLTLTVFGNAPCGNDADDMDLTIVPAPTAYAGANATRCSDATLTLNATATNYSSLLWTTSGDGSFDNDAIEDPVYTPGPTDISTGSVTLTLTAFGNAPCGNNADNMLLTLIAAATSDAGLDATICSDGTHTLDATATNYSSLQWATSGDGSFNNDAIEDPVYTPGPADISTGSVTLTLTAFGNVPCGNDVDDMDLIIVPAPTADAGSDATICSGDVHVLNATATNYSGLQWSTSGDGSFNDSFIEDPTYTPGPNDISNGSVILTLTAFGNAPCGNDVDDMTIFINLPPTADAGLDATICSDSTHALNATATNYSSLQWATSGDGSFNNDAIEDPVYTPGPTDISSGSVTLTLTAFGNAPCGNNADDMDLTIITAPSADAGLDATICSDGAHTLNATATNYSSLQWTTSGDGSFNNDAIEDPIYTPGPTDISSGSVTLT